MSLIVFFMINFVGDPVDMLVNPESLPEEIERVRKDFGLDQPVHICKWREIFKSSIVVKRQYNGF